jgi:type IVB pilus formation R64 PilN family outer membrane protein
VLTSNSDSPVKFEGSKAIFQALSSLGKIHDKRSVSLTTTNNQPAPFALTNQTGYLAKIEAVAVPTDGATGSPGLTPGVVTTGFIMNVIPTILDNSKILLHFSMDRSKLESLDKKTSGENSIETPVISSEQILQRLVLRSNETVIIAPYEDERGSYDKTSLDRRLGVLAGGSFSGRTEKTVTVILITPTLLEGA